MVPRVGLEPTHLAAGDFESPASTNFATWASEEVLESCKAVFEKKLNYFYIYLIFNELNFLSLMPIQMEGRFLKQKNGIYLQKGLLLMCQTR